MHAVEQVRRAALGGYFVSAAGLAAWTLGLANDTPRRHVPSAIGIALVGVVVSFFTGRGSRVAAGLLLGGYVVAAVFLVVSATHPIYIGSALIVWGWPVSAARHAFVLPRLTREFAVAWTPRDVQPGDVYTVRDAGSFSVTKVLAADESRVHVRQYAMRHTERPWHVKSSTLERAAATGGPGAYPHLPLDRAEFLRWEPVLLRTEPVLPAETAALTAWRTLHEPGADGGPVA